MRKHFKSVEQPGTSTAGEPPKHATTKPNDETLKESWQDQHQKSGRTYGAHASMPILAEDKYAEVDVPELEEWNLDELKLDGTIIAIGKRRTGKSWAFRNIMFHVRREIDAGIVISQTDELNGFWRQYVPAQYIYKKYDPSVLDMVFARQKAVLNDKSLSEEEAERKARFFILLDDVISDDRLKYDENLRELFVAGRHYKLFVLITTQYAKGINPTLRGNADYVLLFKNIHGVQKECLWQDFGNFLTKDAFMKIMDHYTENQEVMVVDTSHDNNNVMDNLKWWKAVDPGPFKFGSEKFQRDPSNAEKKVIPQVEEQVSFSADQIVPNAMGQQVIPKYWQRFMN